MTDSYQRGQYYATLRERRGYRMRDLDVVASSGDLSRFEHDKQELRSSRMQTLRDLLGLLPEEGYGSEVADNFDQTLVDLKNVTNVDDLINRVTTFVNRNETRLPGAVRLYCVDALYLSHVRLVMDSPALLAHYHAPQLVQKYWRDLSRVNYWLKADYYIAYGLWDQWSADQQRRLLNSAMNPPGDMTFLWLQLLIRAEQVALRNGDGETVRLCIDLCRETTIPSVRTQQIFLLRIAKLTLVDALDHSMESVAALDQLQDDLAIVATPFYCDLLRDTRAALTTAHNNGLVVATSNKHKKSPS